MKLLAAMWALFLSSSVFASSKIPAYVCIDSNDCSFAKIIENQNVIAGDNLFKVLQLRNVKLEGVTVDKEHCSFRVAMNLETYSEGGRTRYKKDAEGRYIATALYKENWSSNAFKVTYEGSTSSKTLKATRVSITHFDDEKAFRKFFARKTFHLAPTVYEGELVIPMYQRSINLYRLSHVDCINYELGE